jgi:hypothetical protein
MAVSGDYLKKIRIAIRRYSDMSADLTIDLQGTIEECRADLIRLGLLEATVNDETDLMILDAVKRYARYAFEPVDSPAREKLWEEYRLKADELRRSHE